MPRAVGDVLYQFLGMSLCPSQMVVGNGNKLVDDVYVFDLVVPSNIIGFSDFSLTKNQIYDLCMIFYIQPISDVLPITIYG